MIYFLERASFILSLVLFGIICRGNDPVAVAVMFLGVISIYALK